MLYPPLLPTSPQTSSCVHGELLIGTWQLAALHQRVKEVSSLLRQLIIPHFTSINLWVTLHCISSTVNRDGAEIRVGGMRGADGDQAVVCVCVWGGLMMSDVMD